MPSLCNASTYRRTVRGSISSRSEISRPVRSGCAWRSSRSSRSRAVGVSTPRSQAQIEGRIRPIWAIAFETSDDDVEVRRDSGSEGTSDVPGLRLLDGEVERAQPASCATPGRIRRVGRVRVEGCGEAAPGWTRERGRVLHRLRRRVRRHVVPLLRPGHGAVVDLLGGQPTARAARPAGGRLVLGDTGSSRGRTRSTAARSACASRGRA